MSDDVGALALVRAGAGVAIVPSSRMDAVGITEGAADPGAMRVVVVRALTGAPPGPAIVLLERTDGASTRASLLLGD